MAKKTYSIPKWDLKPDAAIKFLPPPPPNMDPGDWTLDEISYMDPPRTTAAEVRLKEQEMAMELARKGMISASQLMKDFGLEDPPAMAYSSGLQQIDDSVTQILAYVNSKCTVVTNVEFTGFRSEAGSLNLVGTLSGEYAAGQRAFVPVTLDAFAIEERYSYPSLIREVLVAAAKKLDDEALKLLKAKAEVKPFMMLPLKQTVIKPAKPAPEPEILDVKTSGKRRLILE